MSTYTVSSEEQVRCLTEWMVEVGGLVTLGETTVTVSKKLVLLCKAY